MTIERLKINSGDDAFVAYENTVIIDATVLSETSDEFNFDRHPRVSFHIIGKGFVGGSTRLKIQATNDPSRLVWTDLPGNYTIDSVNLDEIVSIPDFTERWGRMIIDSPNGIDPTPTLEVYVHGKR